MDEKDYERNFIAIAWYDGSEIQRPEVYETSAIEVLIQIATCAGNYGKKLTVYELRPTGLVRLNGPELRKIVNANGVSESIPLN